MMLSAHQSAIMRAGTRPEVLAEQAGEIGNLVRQTIRQIRGLSRSLCPLELTGSGLRRALEMTAETITSLFGVKCSFEPIGDLDMPEELIASQIYYIIQEATTNALKHARCNHIRVTIRQDSDHIIATIEDDGRGMCY